MLRLGESARALRLGEREAHAKPPSTHFHSFPHPTPPLSLHTQTHTHILSSLPAASYRGAFDLRNAGDDPVTLDALTGGAWSRGQPYETLSLPAGAHGVGHAVREAREVLAREVRGSYPAGTVDLGLAWEEVSAAAEAAREAEAAAAGAPGPPTGVLEIDWSEAGAPGPGDAVGEVGWMSHDGAAYWL